MKLPLYQRFLALAAFFMFFCVANFAQTPSRDYTGNNKTEKKHFPKKAKKAVLVNKKQPAPVSLASADCDNDVIAPEIHCPAGSCLPGARAAYLISYNGEPWGSYDNIYAMDAVFGPGNWDELNFENADVATLLSPAYKVIFLEGSNNGGYALDAFLTANLPALENWVSAGGALFLNAAPNEGYAPTTINLGFGGVAVQNFVYANEVTVQAPAHVVFNLPFTPANGDFTGGSFLHSIISGPSGLTLITTTDGLGVGLSEKDYGAGKVYFGSMTMPAYHQPQPNAQNMRQNILADLSAFCTAGMLVSADAGACSATVTDQTLDATATDDCVLASLTHDFAGAPDNTTLNGAVLPAGTTLVKWTATDAAGNSVTCETLVLVREPEIPVITCPDDVSVAADPESCGAVVVFTINATDNCLPAPTITSTFASGDLFPNGATTAYATATDASGNAANCSFVVTVTPNPEICNGLDDDCNGSIDDGASGDNVFYIDYDGDGYGNPDQSQSVTACLAPYGYVGNALDCDDYNYYIQPGMFDYCNGIDDNCDGVIDDGAPTWYADTDGDGYGDPAVSQKDCNQPAGFIADNTDCDDTDSYIHPGTLEDCTNLTDENCDGILGENNFTIEEIHTDVYCGSNPDGTITLTLVPAQNYPYISWNNGVCCGTTVSNLSDGTYKVIVTNECGTTKTKTVTILPSAEPALMVNMSGTADICGGAGNGTVTASPADGCGGYTYEWFNGDTGASVSGLSGGVYTVVVTDACGCTQIGTFTINEAYPLSVYSGTEITLLDGTYFVQVVPYGGTAPYKFRHSDLLGGFTGWSNSNGFVGLLPGDYVFEVEDINGCTAQISISLAPFSSRPANEALALTPADGPVPEKVLPPIAENRQDVAGNMYSSLPGWSVSLFPNPNTGAFTIELPAPAPLSMKFCVTNLQGRLLLEKEAEAGSERLAVDAGALPAGLYLLQVVSEGKVIAVEKFVKQ